MKPQLRRDIGLGKTRSRLAVPPRARNDRRGRRRLLSIELSTPDFNAERRDPSFNTQLVHHVVRVRLSRLQNDLVFPRRDVDGIRERLGLDAERVVLLYFTPLPVIVPSRKLPV